MIQYRTTTGITFKTPESWKDVTLQKYIQFLQTFKQDHEFYVDEVEDYKYIVKFVGFWANGIDSNTLSTGAKKDEVTAVYLQIAKALQVPESIPYTNVIEFEDEKYYLPKVGMVQSNVYEFIQAAQVEHRVEELKKNQLEALPDLCAILLRKKDEIYNEQFDEQIRPIRAKQFLRLTMDKALKVGFFLLKESVELKNHLDTYSAAKQILSQHRQNKLSS